MSTPDPAPNPPVHRLVIRSRAGLTDPVAETARSQAEQAGLKPGRTASAKIYLIQADLSSDQLRRITRELLVDPVLESDDVPADTLASVIEIHPLPGVMDPVAHSVADAVESLINIKPRVQSGRRYEFAGLSQSDAHRFAESHLANTVIHHIHDGSYIPDSLPTGSPQPFKLTHIPIRDLSDDELQELSRVGHLFLDLHEMQAIRKQFHDLGRDPTDIELETIAQTWSEHCVHKTLKANIHYSGPDKDTIDWSGRPGHSINPDGSVTINNLLKSTVAAATFELIEDGIDWTLSVFVDNAGIIAFDDNNAICAKVETHNHPSAIEPYGGAATGIGGCIRDIIGTGLAAKPIASTDVFCVGYPNIKDVPAGCLPPARVLNQVVAGVRDYGNRMGIPTVNGAVWFDNRYVGNPLVYCGCIGIMPRSLIKGDAEPGDLIVALGGRTGRDGIHGATFSSTELTDTHADEFSHAVQIGNPIEEKRVLDAIVRARDAEGGPLFTSITDCGAGGFSSAIGEMGEHVGAEVHLDRAPLKYAGLTYDEIWISEAQERMILAVPQANIDSLQRICDEEHVELSVLGTFGHFNQNKEPELILFYNTTEVGRLPMPFLHDGIPTPTREAIWKPPRHTRKTRPGTEPTVKEALLYLLAQPNIASKRSIISQYDHEVQGNTLIKPLVGVQGQGPSNAAVIEPVPGTSRGLAIGCGLATNLGDPELGGDAYQMVLTAIDECVRNLVCVGADPSRIAILDNFCWPSCAKPENLASLVRAAEGCYDGAKAYRTPFISGKDSLNNQFTTRQGQTIEIPPTLLITGIGIVPDIRRCLSSDFKRPGSSVLLIEAEQNDQWLRMGNSQFYNCFGLPDRAEPLMPAVDLASAPTVAAAVARIIREGLALAAHDVSDGGALVTIAEMLIGAGSTIGFDAAHISLERWFSETPAGYMLEVPDEPPVLDILNDFGVTWTHLGFTTDSGRLEANDESIAVEELTEAWLGSVTV